MIGKRYQGDANQKEGDEEEISKKNNFFPSKLQSLFESKTG